MTTTTTAVESKMKLGNIVYKHEDSKFPQLEVIGTKRGEKHTYYLSPFRAYGFQVSGGPNGEGSYGTSEFVGLTNIVGKLEKLIAKRVLNGMALNALHDHSKYYDKVWYPNFENQQILDQFVDACYEWVQEVHMENMLRNIQRRQDRLQETKEPFLKKMKKRFNKK